MKKQNNRAHKRALNVSRRKSRRNTELKIKKKMEKELNESFLHQLDILLDNIEKSIDKVKKSFSTKISKIKYAWKNRRVLGNSSTDFFDLVNFFAARESISVGLAMAILVSCISTSNAKDFYPDTDKAYDVISIEEETRTESIVFEKEYSNMKLSQEIIEDHVKKSMSYIEEEKIALEKDENEEIIEEPLTLESMIEEIEYRYGVSEYEFLYTAAVCLLEAGEEEYDGCYDVASIFLNRITYVSTIDFVNKHYAPNTGTNIYAQAVCPGQFTVSKQKIAKLVNSDMTIYPGFEAVVKCFYTGIPSHDFYRFVAPRLAYKYDCVQLHNGNYFFAEVQKDNCLTLEEVLPNYSVDTESTATNEKEKTITISPKQA